MEVEARLRAFAALARAGTFSAAAAELAISQPAVSKHIAALEAELGALLVERVGRGSRLTAGGRFLAPYVLRAEALLAQGARGVAAFGANGATTLRLAASGTPGTYLLPRAIAKFQAASPTAELSVEMGTSAEVADLVRLHRVELGIVGGYADAPELQAEPLAEDVVVVVGPPALGASRLSRRQLSEATWITREEGSATRWALETAWSDLGIVPRRRLALPSWEAVKLACAAGAGIAACSRLAIAIELKAGTLAILDVPRWNVRRTISLLTAEGVPPSLAAAQFATILREVSAAPG
jgi:DNA-binding transcriptional LysR family regulator